LLLISSKFCKGGGVGGEKRGGQFGGGE
jgi:hypothetical protein